MNTYTIIWLDANALDSDSSFREQLGNAQIFINPDECINYIRTHQNEYIYLISSGSFVREVVPVVYELNNLIQIFLYCGSVMKYAEWGLDYIDKLLMYDHGDDLLERLWSEMESHMRAQAKMYLEKADEYKNRALKYKKSSCG